MTHHFEDSTTAHDQKRRSLSPYLKFVRNLDPETSLETRIEHIAYDAFEDGIDWLADALRESGVSAGVSVPAIHLEDEAVRDGVGRLLESGSEVVVHGYRHTSYMETPYETVDEELTAILDRFETDLDTQPTGFHVPFMRCSSGSVRAAEEHGIEWIVGAEPPGVDTSIAFLQPESPYDLQLFERGHDGPAVTDRLAEAADDAALLLCHPNIHAVHDARESFASFLEAESFAKPSAVAAGETDRPGLLLDCFPPFQVR
ncbi:MAG: polysaccharide deacetylase family protein [Natronomonas sp.]